MNKNTAKWYVSKDGNFKFTTGMNVIRKRHKPNSIFEYPFVSYAALILFGAIDVAMFYQLLTPIVDESKTVLIVGLLALFAGMDFAPVYLAMKLREKRQGYKVDDITLWLLLLSFVLAFTMNCVMRFALRNEAIANTTDVNITGNGITTANSFSAIYSAFCAILPLITSLCSFGISYALSNPLRAELQKTEEIGDMLDEEIAQTEAVLASIAVDGDMLKRMISEDTDHYECSIAMVREQALEYSDYVRQRLKEHMGEAAATNELSKEHRDEFIAKLQDTSDGYDAEGYNHIGCLFESIEAME